MFTIKSVHEVLLNCWIVLVNVDYHCISIRFDQQLYFDELLEKPREFLRVMKALCSKLVYEMSIERVWICYVINPVNQGWGAGKFFIGSGS